MEWFPTTELRGKILEVTHVLQATYQQTGPERGGCHQLPAIDELVLTLLSQSTTDVNSWRGYRALLERFSNWDAVADAPVEIIEAAIKSCGLSRLKAPRIKHLLQRIREDQGSLSLDFLKEYPPDEAIAYLMTFKGVGRKTASCVLLFALDMPAMPVDTHVLRVARRLNLIPEQVGAEAAHDLLECLLPEEFYMAFHVNVIAHGRRTCTAQKPACERCAIAHLCPTGRAFLPSV